MKNALEVHKKYIYLCRHNNINFLFVIYDSHYIATRCVITPEEFKFTKSFGKYLSILLHQEILFSLFTTMSINILPTYLHVLTHHRLTLKFCLKHFLLKKERLTSFVKSNLISSVRMFEAPWQSVYIAYRWKLLQYFARIFCKSSIKF